MDREFFSPDEVVDRESFYRFVEWLVRDREIAEKLEEEKPDFYKYGGANSWQNSSISTYLDCALAGADAQEDWRTEDQPTWKDLAEFLYLGKIYE